MHYTVMCNPKELYCIVGSLSADKTFIAESKCFRTDIISWSKPCFRTDITS